MEMFVCFVKHPGEYRKFLFNCTGFEAQVKPGVNVYCNTKYGVAVGTVDTHAVEVTGPNESVRAILKCCGAYFPLKKVTAVQMELSDADKERIAREWLAEKLGNPLPF